jgi:hypothetical protein
MCTGVDTTTSRTPSWGPQEADYVAMNLESSLLLLVSLVTNVGSDDKAPVVPCPICAQPVDTVQLRSPPLSRHVSLLVGMLWCTWQFLMP